ncbi:HAD family hydrolase [Paenibacillus sp. SN-8-1]|uniref:HAD family hydrolase n=1 Tax=Paenibacillus sp. SN-8-1 TaxID=3435409 RepID=UPI003D9A3817
MIKVVLWDLDGTLLDSEFLAKEGTRFGFQQILGRDPTEEEFSQLVGRPVPVVYKEWFDEDLARQILECGTSYYHERADQIPCYSEIPELLIELKRRGYRMGIVSSKRRIHVMNELQSKGLDALFDAIVTQEDTIRHKPFPDPLELAMRQLNVSHDCCVYIGDQPSDIRAADAARMKSVAALWGDGEAGVLESTFPSKFAHSPIDILEFLPYILPGD